MSTFVNQPAELILSAHHAPEAQRSLLAADRVRPPKFAAMFACGRLTRWAGGMDAPRSTVMLDAGVDLRDVQVAARHAGPRTKVRYDRARKNPDVTPAGVRLPSWPPASEHPAWL
jgi:hypothetical protein